jgi:hypothetical protein
MNPFEFALPTAITVEEGRIIAEFDGPGTIMRFDSTNDFIRYAGVYEVQDSIVMTTKETQVATGNWNTSAVDRKLADKLREEKELEEFAAKVALVRDFGSDVYENKQMLRFDKQFAKEGPVYTYGAVKVLGYWYLSGPSQMQNRYDWDGLILFLVSGDFPVDPENVDFLITQAEADARVDRAVAAKKATPAKRTSLPTNRPITSKRTSR